MNTIGTTFNQIDRIVTQKDETVDLNTENYLLNHYQVVDVKGPETIDGQLTQKAPSSFMLEFNLTDNVDDQKSIEAAKASSSYSGETLRIYYTITINKFAVLDVYIQNEATYSFKKQGEAVQDKVSKAPQLVVGGVGIWSNRSRQHS
ncbi:hypothetical protein CBF34_04475 [Vagococcus penaei]|uniref:Uncharacterized protein n=1 Tax=Vagococcus penaei TaxID=633807 RepID=A0A1Q2D4T1_9ENTE|nr:hypothetical protein [Vagococcus penaei]AQP53285.1 hypothetical protein BW732_02900 [Vagococcus penaei]RSU04055.1 hypothetical protein CBF34_04475 [Vagococcus penaei]